MMKRIFSLLFVAVAYSAAALAQTSLVATLKHGSTISEYYGVSALAEAYAAAATGDVITLSGGEFTAVDIEKAITVRGVGVPLVNENPTILMGAFTIKIPVETTWLTLEGVQCIGAVSVNSTNEPGNDKLPSANILKCYFIQGVQCANSNPIFIHCIFANGLSSSHVTGENKACFATVICNECAIRGAYTLGAYQAGTQTYLAKIDMTNCFVYESSESGLQYSTFNNCIITDRLYWAVFDSNHYISNSLCIGNDFDAINKETNTIIEADLSTVFKTFNGTFTPYETFELTDEAKAKYKGSDGTQVGIYGGTNPFDPTPTNPQIKKFGVSTTNIDGKLNVKINVE